MYDDIDVEKRAELGVVIDSRQKHEVYYNEVKVSYFCSVS